MPRHTDPRGAARLAGAALVYLAALLQGLALVSFPAAAALIKALHGLSDAQYGAIFLPQVAAAVAGALAGGAAARRVGLRALLVLALTANAGSQVLLAASASYAAGPAYAMILVATALLGAGFGLAGAPLNSYPGLLFARRAGTALVAVHTAIGVGLMAGPLALGALGAAWVGYPAALAAACVLAAVAAAFGPLPPEARALRERAAPATPAPLASARFWAFIAIAVLYAFAEGTFANWATIYLAEAKRLPMALAAAALSVFWGALVAGRLAVSVLLIKVPARLMWALLPVLMLAAFLLLPYAETPAAGLALFALAGLACSAFFPLTVALLSEEFMDHVAWVSSMLTAALMLGVGAGAFVVGALREHLALESLYRLSALYPAAMLALIALSARPRPAAQLSRVAS